MNERILYKTESGGVAVIVPTGELPLDEVCRKDVPSGRPYKIVDVSEIPEDRTWRSAWEVDESDLTDGVGADYGVME